MDVHRLNITSKDDLNVTDSFISKLRSVNVLLSTAIGNSKKFTAEDVNNILQKINKLEKLHISFRGFNKTSDIHKLLSIMSQYKKKDVFTTNYIILSNIENKNAESRRQSAINASKMLKSFIELKLADIECGKIKVVSNIIHNANIRNLRISVSSFYNKDIEDFSNALITIDGLKSLTIELSSIENSHYLIKALASMPTLNELSLNSIGNGNVLAPILAEVLPIMTGLKKLRLRSNYITKEGAISLSKGLFSITHLDLSSNQIGDEGAIAIAKGLSCIEQLDLSFNKIGDEGVIALSKKLSSITYLILKYNQIGDEGAIAIAKGLSKMKKLNLSINQISNRGATALEKATLSLSGMVSLDLSYNQLSDTKKHSLASGIIKT